MQQQPQIDHTERMLESESWNTWESVEKSERIRACKEAMHRESS